MSKRKIVKTDMCKNYPELNVAFEQELQDLFQERSQEEARIYEAFNKFKPFLTQAIYGTTECVDPQVRVWAQEGGGFGTKNWRFCHETIINSALEYARVKMTQGEYDEIRSMYKTCLGDDLVNEHCQDKLKEFYGYEYKVYWSEFYRYFIRDMNLFQETFFFTFANVAGWNCWLIVKLFVGLPWALLASVIFFVISGLERIFNFLFKK